MYTECMSSKKILTWQEWKDLGVEWVPQRLTGGAKADICDDHGRKTVSILDPQGRWVDTRLCATDVNNLKNLVKKIPQQA